MKKAHWVGIAAFGAVAALAAIMFFAMSDWDVAEACEPGNPSCGGVVSPCQAGDPGCGGISPCEVGDPGCGGRAN